MKNKIYKGVIHSLLPQKGFGFITPIWANGDSEENIFFHLSETKGGKCFIPALASAENRNEFVSKKGTKTFVPKEPQVVFFELDAQELPTGVKLLAKRIKDSKNVSDEEADQADANVSKPSVDELLHPTEETVNLTVTPDNTIIEENDCDCIALTEYEGGEPVSYTKSDKELKAWLDADPEHSWFPVDDDEEDEDDDEDYDEYEEYQEEFDRMDAKLSRPYRPKENKDR